MPRRFASGVLVAVLLTAFASPLLAAPHEAETGSLWGAIQARLAAWTTAWAGDAPAVDIDPDRDPAPTKDGDDPADPPVDEPPSRHWAQIEPGG